jgi:hypothetical protein
LTFGTPHRPPQSIKYKRDVVKKNRGETTGRLPIDRQQPAKGHKKLKLANLFRNGILKNEPVCLKDMQRMPKLILVFNQGTFFLFSEPFNGIPLHLSDILVESTDLKQCTLEKNLKLRKFTKSRKYDKQFNIL